MPDSREWYVSDNFENRSTFFHLGVTDYVCMFYCLNVLTLLQQFVTRILPTIISSKLWMHMSTPSCPQSLHMYEFLSASAPVTMPTPSMN